MAEETRSRFRACGCIVCGECWGSGRSSGIEDESSSCEGCDGSGISEECSDCEFEREMEADEL